ncbi:MAG: tRNA (adenosine(37)-N6)-dimethylallyltransferase MiaA [Actinobacteria bacterium]|nr:tRNA (adenosine(37)-N6)-dimethylallyltransferase MiaA [Actinomycetota bacterium]
MTGRAPRLLALVGPTASGKTEAAMSIAERLSAEIVSVDSMVVYRGMDVGTAKPTPEDRARVAYHLLDLAEPSEPFSVARFQVLGLETIADIRARARRPLLVGGSGLYFRALVDRLEFPETDPATRAELELEATAVGLEPLHRRLADLDPVAAAKIEPGNLRRTVRALEVVAITGRPFSSFAGAWERYPDGRAVAAGVRVPREVLGRRIEARVDRMIAVGFLQEVRSLLDRGFGGWLTSTQAIGYAEMAAHLEGRVGFQEAVAETVKRTKALARRQMAWFRRDPRIRWFEAGEEGAAALTDEILEHLGMA